MLLSCLGRDEAKDRRHEALVGTQWSGLSLPFGTGLSASISIRLALMT